MKKKIITFVIVVVILFVVAAASLYGYKYYQSQNTTVEVMPVYDISWGSWDDGSANSYGIVVNDSMQEIYLSYESKINEIYVNEGDSVEEGAPLFMYDIESISGEIEQKKLDIDSVLNDIEVQNHRLSELKNSTPVDKTEPKIDEKKLTELQELDEKNNSIPETTEENGNVYNYLTNKAVPVNATVNEKTNKIKYPKGTVEDPYIFYCSKDAFAYGSFYNFIRPTEKKAGKYVIVYIENEEGEKKVIDGSLLPTEYDTERMWYVFSGKERFESNLAEEYQNEFDEEYAEWEEPDGYTKEELKEEITEIEKTLKTLDVQYRKLLLQLSVLEDAAKDGVVYATVSGKVEKIENPDEVYEDMPFLVVKGQGDLYVKGVMNELLLEHATVGTVITLDSWETGMTYQANITEIGDIPISGNYLGEGNPNVSYYSFTAYVEKDAELSNNEYVDLMIEVNEYNEDSIYIEKAYIRDENGKHYCMIADENGKLKKQYVLTGKTLYGSAIEIKSGLTEDDYIAFPYGKDVVEGATVIEKMEY